VMSARHAPILCVLVGLALVPAVIHSYVGVTGDDGRTTAAIPLALAGYVGQPSGRNETWGKRRFDSDDWMERRYVSLGRADPGTPADATLTVVRTYDLKAVYHHPELAVAYGRSFLSHEVVRLADRPHMPVHVLRGAGEGDRAAAFYVLHYDDRFIEHPLRFQIEVAGRLLVSPRMPMTLFFVLVPGVSHEIGIDQLAASQLLMAAVDSFLVQGS
jgi:hypothetical protein